MFDWQLFFERHRIDYIRGRPLRPGELGISCPWCAEPDKMHLRVSTEGRGFHCWKGRKAHSGVSPVRLIVALLGCTSEEALRLVESENASFARSDESFADDAMRRLGVSPPKVRRQAGGSLELLPEFQPIRGIGVDRMLVMPYLRQRGYDAEDAIRLAEMYGLRFALNGPFAYRIVIPVVVDGRLVNWTARTVADSDELRYKSLSTDLETAARQGLPAAAMNIKDAIFDQDRVAGGGRLLVVTEGPFDAMRVGFFGNEEGVRGTALFGLVPSSEQIAALSVVVGKYDRAVCVFDRGAEFDSFLSLPDYLGIRRVELPPGIKDPADLRYAEFARLFLS